MQPLIVTDTDEMLLRSAAGELGVVMLQYGTGSRMSVIS